MVLQRRLNYGFNGYQVPVVPRGSRTTRGRGSIRKKVDDDQIRAFEILATVAGNFLQERENSASLNTAEIIDQHAINKYIDKRGWKDVEQTMKLKAYAPRSHDRDAFAFAATSQGGHQTKSQRESFANKVVIASSKNACGISSRKVVDTSSEYGKSFESMNGRNLDVELLNIRSSTNGTVSDRNSSKDSMELDRKPASLVSSDGCFRASVFKDCDILRPFSRCEGNIGVVIKDDDENSCGCFQRGTRTEAYGSLLRNGDQRIRKLLAAKHCRAASNLKQKGYFNTDGKMKPVYRNWKSCYVRQRSQRISSFKRRRFLGRRPVSSSDGGFSCKGLFNSFEKGMIGGNSYAAREVSSSVAGQQETPLSGDCNVKLSIKSLRVPELLIEIPVNSTVGSLKRAVMEAVTAVLGDRLHVGMLLQGKKVKDDSKTLHQTGISQDSKLHSLGFMLERKNEKDLPLPPGGTPSWLSRYSAPSISEPGTSNDSAALPAENLSNCLENGLDTFPHIFGVSNEKTIAESKALVAEKAMGVEALAVVPIRNQSKRPEFGQRRIRRPFSVSEVEALVQAVEKIGTGRWRDVKLCAFDGAKHRTYVDLKDKWKTLVHTAKLLPQQRRGEPVPQDLLDRVMAAHAYWCQEQAKLQV